MGKALAFFGSVAALFIAACLYLPIPINAQILAPILTGFTAPAGGGVIALVQSGMTATASAGGTATTSAKSTVGANLLVACIADYQTTTDSFSSVPSNTWTLVASYIGTNTQTSMYIAYNANVSATQTFSNVGNYTGFAVLAFSNTQTSPSPLDQHNGSDGATGQPGSITPTVNNELVVNCNGSGGTNPTALTGGGTLTDTVPWVNGTNQGLTNAYIVQTTATPINPTWNTSGGDAALIQASFKP